MSRKMSKFLGIFASLFLLILSNIFTPTAQAANGCSIRVNPTSVGPEGSVIISIPDGVWNDQPISTARDGSFYIETSPGGKRVDVNFVNGVGTVELDYTFFEINGTTVNLNLYHWNGVWGDFACGPSSVFIEESNAPPANLSCESVIVVPNNIALGQTTPLPTLTATGCDPDAVFRINVEKGTYQQSTDVFSPHSDGTINLPLNFFPEEGIYEVTLVNIGSITSFSNSVTVQGRAEEIEYQCDQSVPPGTPNCAEGESGLCCPSQCSAGFRPVYGSTQLNDFACLCGDLENQACCPGSICRNGLTCNESGKCETPATGTYAYYCGEQIDPEDVANPGSYYCVDARCPLAQFEGTDAYWCSCGSLGNKCCDTGYRCETGLLCSLDTCVEPEIVNDRIPIFCDDQRSIHTALGCFNIENYVGFIISFVALLLGTSGGIALLTIGYAALRIATSSGDPRTLGSSKELLASAISGILMVALSIYLLRVIGVDILGLFS